MFISFEGLDYSGKTTQAAILADALKRDGREVLLLREPGGTAISEKVRSILLDGEHGELTSVAELLLFSAARNQLVQQVIRPALEKKKIVICDRFVDSTTVYQGFGRGLNLEDVKAVNRISTGGIMPEFTFFLDIEVEEMLRRREVARGTADRMESSGIEFFRRVRDGFWILAQESPIRFIVINGTRSIDLIHSEIRDFIYKKASL
jgi:dTMP kinase